MSDIRDDMTNAQALMQNYQRNIPYVAEGNTNWRTSLPDAEERMFRAWVRDNDVPFNPSVGTQDYDMRGFWRALQSGDTRATSAVDPNDGKLHYPDTWKTPYHATFSNESIWANPKTAPRWNDQDQLVTPDGKVLFDDRAAKP